MCIELLKRFKKLQESLQATKSNSMNNNQIEEVKESKVLEKKVITNIKRDIKAEPKSVVKYGKGYAILGQDVLKELEEKYKDTVLDKFNSNNIKPLEPNKILHYIINIKNNGDTRPCSTTALTYKGKIFINYFDKISDHNNQGKLKQIFIDLSEYEYTYLNDFIETVKIPDTFDTND